MEVSAILRGTRLSAQKGRLVADQVRGLRAPIHPLPDRGMRMWPCFHLLTEKFPRSLRPMKVRS